jgi:hypothetical protein
MLGSEIATYLADLGFGVLDETMFVGPWPFDTTADAVACVVEHGGRSQGTFGEEVGEAAFDEGEFQVLVRGGRNDALGARTRAQAMRDKLHRLGPVTLGSARYMDVRATLVYFVRWDENGRAIYSFRCETELE